LWGRRQNDDYLPGQVRPITGTCTQCALQNQSAVRSSVSTPLTVNVQRRGSAWLASCSCWQASSALLTLVSRNPTMKLHILVLSFVVCRLRVVAFVCRPPKSTLRAGVPEVLDISSLKRSACTPGSRHPLARRTATALSAENKVASMVSGEELEKMLVELDQPLVVDAYATWYATWNKCHTKSRLRC
jgi:hypothetical protein